MAKTQTPCKIPYRPRNVKSGIEHHRARHTALALHLRLPRNFIDLVRKGQLEQEIERCRVKYWRLIEALDAFEAANPRAARQLPWFKAPRDVGGWWSA